jgi:predicted nucleotidyltransferase
VDFRRVHREITSFLGERGFPSLVCGAFALQAYGLSRATQDLDFVVPVEAQEALVGFLEEQGYETLNRSAAFSNHLHADPGRGRIDFIYVSGATSQLVFQHARTHSSPSGLAVRVPSPEHLVAMKVLAMKNDPERTFREMADLQFLLGLPEVDQEEARRYFERHGQLERYLEIKRLSS